MYICLFLCKCVCLLSTVVTPFPLFQYGLVTAMRSVAVAVLVLRMCLAVRGKCCLDYAPTPPCAPIHHLSLDNSCSPCPFILHRPRRIPRPPVPQSLLIVRGENAIFWSAEGIAIRLSLLSCSMRASVHRHFG